MRRIATLLSAVFLPLLFVLIPVTAAQAAVTVNMPGCGSFYLGYHSKLDCMESSSPAGVTVTWTLEYYGHPQWNTQGTSSLIIVCVGDQTYTVSFGYTSGGVTYSSNAAEVDCLPSGV